jgi:hypothetical protein
MKTLTATFSKAGAIEEREFRVVGLLTETKLNARLREFGAKKGIEFINFKFN